MSLTVPRVLRIGIVHNGSIVTERLIPPSQSVTVGSTPDATFTVPVPMATTPIFSVRRGKYRLEIPDQAQGRVATAAGVVDLTALRAARGRRPVLEETDRGKVVIGEITVLFQLVEPPPMPARMLKGHFRPRLIDEDDPAFLGILSLLTAATAVMMVHVSTLTPPALVQFEEIPDYFVHNIQLDPPEAPDPVVEDDPPEIEVIETPDGPGEAIAQDDAPEEPESVAPERSLSPEERAIADARATQARKEEVIRQSALLTQLIRSRGEGAEIFGTEDAAGEELAAAMNGISSGPDVVSIDGPRGPTDRRGRGEAGLEGGITRDGGGQYTVIDAPEAVVEERTVTGRVVKPPTTEIQEDIREQVANALPLLSSRVRSCYERRIKIDPTIQGRLVLEVDLTGGRVSDAFASGTIHDEELLSCVESAARKWQVPGVDGETLRLPFALTAVE